MTKHIKDGIDLYFPPKEREIAATIEAACRRSISVIDEAWGFPHPKRCRVYVVTSSSRFAFQAAPWYAYAPPYLALLPFWFFRLRKTWRISGGGWMARFPHGTPTIGIKAQGLQAKNDRSMGEEIFTKDCDAHKKTEGTVCHELTHVFSAHLKLPFWLNEGIAMLTVDRYFGRETVAPESLSHLNDARYRKSVAIYRELSNMSEEMRRYHYLRGYWLTRFLQNTNPGLLKELLQKKHDHLIKTKIAFELGMQHGAFWEEIDERVIAHFSKNSVRNEPRLNLNLSLSWTCESCGKELHRPSVFAGPRFCTYCGARRNGP